MTFYEFLDAAGENRYRAYLEEIDRIEPIPDAFHNELTGLLQSYYLVGGMPEVVNRHAADPGLENGRVVQKAILDSYTLDFAKHAPSSDIPKLPLVWESLPSQLARKNKKFLFSVVKEGALGDVPSTRLDQVPLSTAATPGTMCWARRGFAWEMSMLTGSSGASEIIQTSIPSSWMWSTPRKKRSHSTMSAEPFSFPMEEACSLVPLRCTSQRVCEF